MKHIKSALALVVLLLVVVFTIANRTPVRFSLDAFNPDNPAVSIVLPLFLLVFIAIGLGLAIGFALGYVSQSQNRRTARAVRKLERIEAKQAKRREKQNAPPSKPQPAPDATDITANVSRSGPPAV